MKKYIATIILMGIISIVILVLFYRKTQVDSLIKPNSVFPLKLSWEIDMGGLAYDRPIYQNGMVFSTANELVFSGWYAVRADTGDLEWVQQRMNRGNFFRCLTAEYLVVSGPWSLAAIQIDTGAMWVTKNPPAYTATCNEKMVFSGGNPRDSISIYELKSGQMIRYGTKPDKSFSGLVYNDDTEELIAGHRYELYIIDPQTSVLKYSFEKLASPPDDNSPYRGPMYLIDHGELFIGGTVQNAQTGQLIHKEDNFKTDYLPTVTTDSMYLSTRSAGIVSFDRDDYSVKWIYQPQPSNPLAPLGPIATLGKVGYAIFSDATVRAFDLETGQEVGYWQPSVYDLWFWPICSFPPGFCSSWARAGLTTSEDTLFVSFGDGKLYAFGK